MKTTGVIRKLDELGRITLPIELRRSLDLDVKDGLEITVQDDCIILQALSVKRSYRNWDLRLLRRKQKNKIQSDDCKIRKGLFRFGKALLAL